MSVYVLLDILLLILIALFVPIGFWRGAQREVLVTLGILFGAALATAWADPWGQDLASLTQLREAGGAFVVAVLFLIGGTFLIGYGAGAALPVPRPGLVSRLFGALIAGGNGALLLSLALSDIRIYLLTDQNPGFLDNALVARFLSTGTGWILLAGAVIFLPVVLSLALFGQHTTFVEVIDEAAGESEIEDVGATHYFPPRVPVSRNDRTTATYKAEPPRSTPRQASEETRPLTIQHAPDPGDYRPPQRSRDEALIDWAAAERDAQKTVQMDAVAGKNTNAAHAPVEDGKCPHCHADVHDAEVFCPRCGRML